MSIHKEREPMPRMRTSLLNQKGSDRSTLMKTMKTMMMRRFLKEVQQMILVHLNRIKLLMSSRKSR